MPMTTETRTRIHHSEQGFTLLEMLLTVLLFGGVMIVLFSVVQDLGERELAKSTAHYMESVAEAVEDTMTSDVNNFLGFYNDALLDSVNLNAEYNIALFIAGGVVGATSPRTIPPSAKLNDNFSPTSPLKQEIRILTSVADDPLDPNDPPALDILIVTNGRAHDEAVRKAAGEAGVRGAFLRNAANPLDPTQQIRSAFGAWQLPIGRFIDLPWYINVQANLPSADDGAYLVHHLYVNFQDISGDYLFRTPQADTSLHAMLTPMNLGGNNIVGVDDLITTGDVTVNSQVIVQGAAQFGDSLAVTGSLYGDGKATANTIRIDHGSVSGGAGNAAFVNEATFASADYSLGGNNNLLTLGDITVGTLNMHQGGDISAEEADLQNVSIGEIDTARRAGAGGTATIMGDFIAQDGSFVGATSLQVAGGADVRFSNSLEATELRMNGGTLDVTNGTTGVVNINTRAQMNVTGAVTAPRISVQNFGVTEFGECDNGCGE